jgi:PIN domain nuclease of toxin-antitoxin system
MRLLLDSNAFLWLLYTPEVLGGSARTVIAAADTASVSTATLWEFAIKHAKGKLPHPPADLAAGCDALGLDELPVARRHLVALADVVLPHADPFDTLLVAQAMMDGLTLVTADAKLLASGYRTIDARR